jgi:hypothetical protein
MSMSAIPFDSAILKDPIAPETKELSPLKSKSAEHNGKLGFKLNPDAQEFVPAWKNGPPPAVYFPLNVIVGPSSSLHVPQSHFGPPISQGTIHLTVADGSLIMRNGTFADSLVTPRKVHRTHLIRALLAGVVLSGPNVGFWRQYCATIDS